MDQERLLETLEQRILRAIAGANALPQALTRRRAAKELSISLSKLKGLIRSGAIFTCEDPSLIPASEVMRLARPKAPAAVNSQRPRGRRIDTYDADEEARKIREFVKAERKKR